MVLIMAIKYVEIVEWSRYQSTCRQKVRVLGQPGENEVEMLSILVKMISFRFPSDVIEESTHISKEISPEFNK